MKRIGIVSTIVGTAALSLLLGVAAPAFAQEDKHEDEAKSAKQEEKKAPEAKPEEKKAQQEKNVRPEEKNAKQENAKQEQQHAGGGRIPADRYKANFGREHTFRVSQGDYNNHRFQYGGYWFGFGGAWPGNWLYTQDVYVIEIDGVYYLCNPVYPGVNVVLNVTL